MSDIDTILGEVGRLNREATEGPWQWFGNTKTYSCCLATTHSGRMYVLDFTRWGMREAQPRFRWPVGANGGLMYDLAKMPAECGPRFEVEYRRDFVGINHPDAELIAYYRTACPILADEIVRLRDDLAVVEKRSAGLVAAIVSLREKLDGVEKYRAALREVRSDSHYCPGCGAAEECASGCVFGDAAKGLE